MAMQQLRATTGLPPAACARLGVAFPIAPVLAHRKWEPARAPGTVLRT
jgi:hypothetical protein